MSSPIKCLLGSNVRRILDLLNDGIIITDEKAIVHYINPAYTLYSGLEFEDIVNKYLPEVRPGAMLPKVLEDHKPIRNFPRKVGKVESYCDFIPIIIEGKLVGGIAIVKDVVRIKDLLQRLEESKEKIVQLDNRVKDSFKAKFTFSSIVGREGGLKNTITMCYKAAQTDSPVLLLGESGTGKEVLAQSIHNASKRKEYPFVDINCGALPENLLESELFGYEAGAFTGARKNGKLGLFEIANGGTIFLDEITEMPINLQTKLLRVLQEQRILKIGSEKALEINVRVIAATNKNVLELVKEKSFREDLYFRLAVFVISIPALRERKEDITLLVQKFIEEQQRKQKHVIFVNSDAMHILKYYDWPGNIREIKNIIEYACNVTEDYTIKPEDIPQNILKFSSIKRLVEQKRNNMTLAQIVGDVEKKIIRDYLTLYGNDVPAKKRIAQELNISIATLYNKIKRYNL